MDRNHTPGARVSGAADNRTGLSPQICRVDPISFAAEASAILKCAWRPPCLDYTPEYLQFQCGFPTTLDPIALAAYQGDEAVGFVAATGRRSNIGDLYLSSFLSLVPGSLPSLSIALVRHQTRIIQGMNKPALVFAQAGSTGEYLLKCIESVGMKRIMLGEYRIHAAMPKSAALDVRVEQMSGDEWVEEAERMRDGSLLSPVFDAASLEHFVKDPGGRKFLSVRDGNKVIAVTMQGYTPTVTATGIDQIPALHHFRLAEQRADAVTALLAFAKTPAYPIVTVPNAVGISQSVARAAGLRATGSVFAAYLCFNDNDFPPFRGTDFEIV